MNSDKKEPLNSEVTTLHNSKSNWFRITKILAVVLISGGLFGYFFRFNNGQSSTKISENQAYITSSNHPKSSPTPIVLPKISPMPGWKIYTSFNEKASFRYPESWSIVKSLYPTDSYSDSISLQSTDKEVTINWDSFVNGLGGGCGDTMPPLGQGGCPLITFLNKLPISGAQGLYVVSATVTSDGRLYKPVLAVQDSTGDLFKTWRQVGYDEYTSRTLRMSGTLFSTGKTYADGPILNQIDANAWFNKPSIQQAKLILESLTY